MVKLNQTKLKNEVKEMTEQLEQNVQNQIDKLSETLIDRRNELGYSQAMLAKMAGFTQPQVSDNEQLKRGVKLPTFLKHITALGLEIQIVPKKIS
jgi:DNA-binding XRE family transcriptional regulator